MPHPGPEADRAPVSGTPLLSIIVPVYREGGKINELIGHLLQLEKGGSAEIILVDGDAGSTLIGESRSSDDRPNRDLAIQVDAHPLRGSGAFLHPEWIQDPGRISGLALDGRRGIDAPHEVQGVADCNAWRGCQNLPKALGKGRDCVLHVPELDPVSALPHRDFSLEACPVVFPRRFGINPLRNGSGMEGLTAKDRALGEEWLRLVKPSDRGLFPDSMPRRFSGRPWYGSGPIVETYP